MQQAAIARFHTPSRERTSVAITVVALALVVAAMVAGIAQLHHQPPFATDDPSSILFQTG